MSRRLRSVFAVAVVGFGFFVIARYLAPAGHSPGGAASVALAGALVGLLSWLLFRAPPRA